MEEGSSDHAKGASRGRAELPTRLRLVHARSGEPHVQALKDTIVLASSESLGWDGVTYEIGMSPAWASDDVALPGYLAVRNVGSESALIERKTSHGFVKVEMPPGAVWLNQAGASFTQRNGAAHWNACEISVDRVRRILGCDLELPPFEVLRDERLASVMGALSAEVAASGGSGPLFADSLTLAFAARLAQLAGASGDSLAPRGALAGRTLPRVREWIESALAETIRVADLAAVAGLSPAHFAREFRRLTGEPPYVYVMRRRVERARQLLESGHSIAEAASACGFADQAHLSRLFRRFLGITPGSLMRRGRGRTPG